MHAGHTGWLFAHTSKTTAAQGLVWQGAYAIALWIFALLVVSLGLGSPKSASTQEDHDGL